MEELKVIFEILYKIFYENARSEKLIDRFKSEDLNYNYVTKNVYGVLENKLYLDYLISSLSNIKLSRLNKEVLILLEIGVYNIYFLNTKDYATVNNLVELSKTFSNKFKGYVNAILRNCIRKKGCIKINTENELEYLSIKYSHPLNLIEYLRKFYPLNFMEKLLIKNNMDKKISIRVNNLLIEVEDLQKKLNNIGYNCKLSKISDNCLILDNSTGIFETELFKNGYFHVQSEPSCKVAEISGCKKGMQILDLCAFPGGKSINLAQITGNKAKIVSNDISLNKVRLMEENIKRLGLNNIEITNFDASKRIEQFDNRFDLVICDLPCSGLGLLSKKIEIRYNFSVKKVRQLAKLQKTILNQACNYLKKDGVIVFSTCTMGDYENIDNYNFLASKSFLKPVEIENSRYLSYNIVDNDCDGFFICKFQRG